MIIPLTITVVLAGLWMACVIANLIEARRRERATRGTGDLTECIRAAAKATSLEKRLAPVCFVEPDLWLRCALAITRRLVKWTQAVYCGLAKWNYWLLSLRNRFSHPVAPPAWADPTSRASRPSRGMK